jgi:NDP-sugar pyrophosphorylase family protein
MKVNNDAKEQMKAELDSELPDYIAFKTPEAYILRQKYELIPFQFDKFFWRNIDRPKWVIDVNETDNETERGISWKQKRITMLSKVSEVMHQIQQERSRQQPPQAGKKPQLLKVNYGPLQNKYPRPN